MNGTTGGEQRCIDCGANCIGQAWWLGVSGPYCSRCCLKRQTAINFAPSAHAVGAHGPTEEEVGRATRCLTIYPPDADINMLCRAVLRWRDIVQGAGAPAPAGTEPEAATPAGKQSREKPDCSRGCGFSGDDGDETGGVSGVKQRGAPPPVSPPAEPCRPDGWYRPDIRGERCAVHGAYFNQDTKRCAATGPTLAPIPAEPPAVDALQLCATARAAWANPTSDLRDQTEAGILALAAERDRLADALSKEVHFAERVVEERDRLLAERKSWTLSSDVKAWAVKDAAMTRELDRVREERDEARREQTEIAMLLEKERLGWLATRAAREKVEAEARRLREERE